MRQYGNLFITLLIALAACAPRQQLPESHNQDIIIAYTEAYNARDIDAMTALMHPAIQWLSAEGSQVEVFADGKANLTDQMTSYIASPSATQSSLSEMVVNGPFIAVRETARWTQKDGSTGEQSALAVYEIEGELVRRVTYYPATP